MLYLGDCRQVFYGWSGNFEASSEDWILLNRVLRDYELLVVTDGVLYIADHRREYEVKAGEYLLMSPSPNQHGYRKSKCTFYWVNFGIVSVQRDSEMTDQNGLELVEKEQKAGNDIVIPEAGILAFPERILILIKQLQDSARRYHNHKLNDNLIMAVLYEIQCQNSTYKGQKQHVGGTRLFGEVVDYIRYHICENIRVADLASYFGYNSKYLSAIFKRQAGITLKQFILQAKMDYAMAQLSDTEHTVSQVAFGVGFQDVHNFTNAFKKITGISPTQYRYTYGEER